MRFTKLRIAALGAALVLAGCGGGGGAGDQASRVPFSSMVSFGDSLSDVGTYKVGTVAAIGGGKFTVNGTGNLVWTERIAANIGTTSCPAQTGFSPNIPGLTGAAVVQNTSCFNYAQGSSRVSNPLAPHALSLQQAFGSVNIGMTATPVSVQIANHLARKGGTFSGTELVTVMAGGNDIFMQTNGLQAAGLGGAQAVGAAIAAGWGANVQGVVVNGGDAAKNAAAVAAISFMGAAGAELAALVKTQIVAKGAKYVVVVNLPDVSQAPSSLAEPPLTRALINQMVTTFNTQLASGLQGTAGVILVDAYSQGQHQVAHPAQYSLSNVTNVACSTTSPNNPLGGFSIGCSAASLIAGDTSHYLFADSVHPTPYGHQLLAQYVAVQMAMAGWL